MDLLEEMRQCKSVQACIDVALIDAYGEEEEAVAWLSCIEEMFGRFAQVSVMGRDVVLIGFDLRHGDVVAVCRDGKHKARLTLDSVDFPGLTPIEKRWLQAWKQYLRSSA